MILLADENVHRLVSDRLAARSHEVSHISDLPRPEHHRPRGPRHRHRKALLVTNDLDFGELVYTGGARHTGVLLLRLGDLPFEDQADLIARVIDTHGDQLRTAFSVLDPSRLRIRGTS